MEARPEGEMSRPMMRVQASWANWRTQARPMEPPAPVMRATLEGGEGGLVFLLQVGGGGGVKYGLPW